MLHTKFHQKRPSDSWKDDFLGRESKKNRVVLNKYSILVFRRILYTLYSLSMSPVVFSLKLLYKIAY